MKAPDGTVWQKTSNDSGSCQAGRLAIHNVLTETPGPTSFAKRQIVAGSVLSAFSLIIDDAIIHEIKRCTELEARTRTNNPSWSVTEEEFLALLAIIYARGILAKGHPLDFL